MSTGTQCNDCTDGSDARERVIPEGVGDMHTVGVNETQQALHDASDAAGLQAIYELTVESCLAARRVALTTTPSAPAPADIFPGRLELEVIAALQLAAHHRLNPEVLDAVSQVCRNWAALTRRRLVAAREPEPFVPAATAAPPAGAL